MSVADAAAQTGESTEIRIVLGSMTFGAQTDATAAATMLRDFAPHSVEIDTARSYSGGRCEDLLGTLIHEQQWRVASKANAYEKGRNLGAASLEVQLQESLAALKIAKLDIFYLHAPDPKTPISETLAKVDELHKRNLFTELGLSNYAAWEVALVDAVCQRNGWVRPTVYQGMLNAITRDVETELLPCLRALKIRFYAYNPLAGGLLACKEEAGSRLSPSSSTDLSKMYRKRYLASAQVQACEIVKAACDNAGIPPTEAALRWVHHHARLRPGDALILGASKVDQLAQNLRALKNGGPLPKELLLAYKKAWHKVRDAGACPSYHRGTSKYDED